MKLEKKKFYIIKNRDGDVGATNVMAQGEELATLEELNQNKWLFERFENAVFIVKEK